MKIWKFSASGLLRGVSAAAFAGAVVLGLALPAQATLIGDNISVTTNVDNGAPNTCTPCVDGNGTEMGGLLVGAGPELATGDGSGFGNLFTGVAIPGNILEIFAPTGSIDILESSILLSFGFPNTGVLAGSSTGFIGSFVFSDLDWIDFEAGVIDSVTGVVLGDAVLSSALVINEVMDHSFRVALNCITPITPVPDNICVPDSTSNLLEIDLTIVTTGHEVINETPVPEPSSLLLLGSGLLGLAGWRWRKDRAVTS